MKVAFERRKSLCKQRARRFGPAEREKRWKPAKDWAETKNARRSISRRRALSLLVAKVRTLTKAPPGGLEPPTRGLIRRGGLCRLSYLQLGAHGDPGSGQRRTSQLFDFELRTRKTSTPSMKKAPLKTIGLYSSPGWARTTDTRINPPRRTLPTELLAARRAWRSWVWPTQNFPVV